MMNKNSLCQNQTKYIGLKNRKHTTPQAKCAELWSCGPVTMHHLYTNYHVSIFFLLQYFNLLKKDKMRNNRISRI